MEIYIGIYIYMLSRFRKDSSQSGYTFYYEENKNPVL